jgi:uncharacterized protein YlxW (UPF0749 family)|tara:strand:- start:686 stop:919 length:234 start_codon:yes stop_codon:yes gene_type:complete
MSKQDQYTKQQFNQKIRIALKDLEEAVVARFKLDCANKEGKEAAKLRKELTKLKKEYNKLKAENEKKSKALTKLLEL